MLHERALLKEVTVLALDALKLLIRGEKHTHIVAGNKLKRAPDPRSIYTTTIIFVYCETGIISKMLFLRQCIFHRFKYIREEIYYFILIYIHTKLTIQIYYLIMLHFCTVHSICQRLTDRKWHQILQNYLLL